jgi:hypothetical protein
VHSALWPYVAAGVALVGASVIVATPVAPLLPLTQVRVVQLTAGDDVTLAIGGSGTPIPSQEYVDEVTSRYITPAFPDFTTDNAPPLFTPEGLSPIFTLVKSLPLDESVAQGLRIPSTTKSTPATVSRFWATPKAPPSPAWK